MNKEQNFCQKAKLDSNTLCFRIKTHSPLPSYLIVTICQKIYYMVYINQPIIGELHEFHTETVIEKSTGF